MLSVNGRIDWSRHRWSGGIEGSDCPVDRLLDRTEQTVSVGVRQLCAREGTSARSFARGRENLKHAAQIVVGEELFRQLVESEGKIVLKASAQEGAGSGGCPATQLELDWSAASCKAQSPDGQETTRIYFSADGVLVPTITRKEKDKRRAKALERRAKMPRDRRGRLKRLGAVKKGTDQRYKQVYETCVFDQNQEHRLVGVTCRGVPGLKRLLRREANRVRLRGAEERLGIVDGAVCLRNHLEGLPLTAILLDFYHLGEHVGEAGVKTLGSQTPQCEQWLGDVLHTVRHEGYAPFFQKLMDWRGSLRGGKREAANDLIGYVSSRQEMIRYEECERKGWHVGSGAMESMCGVTTDRIKGRGRRWDLDNAEAMMTLEALYQSTGMWDRHWSNVLSQQN